MDAKHIINASLENGSVKPVTTALYTISVVMNEDDPNPDSPHVEKFAMEFQQALDNGYFTDLRYDAMTFDVLRIVLHTAPANEKENA